MEPKAFRSVAKFFAILFAATIVTWALVGSIFAGIVYVAYKLVT